MNNRTKSTDLQVLCPVDLLVNSLPAVRPGGGFLQIYVVPVNRSPPAERRRLPQEDDGGVANLQHAKVDRSP